MGQEEEILPEEYELLKKLEKELGEIPKVTKIEREAFGFKAEEGYVVELGLTRKGENTLLKIISQLPKSRKLDLWGK